MILFSENQQPVLSFIIALLRPRKAPWRYIATPRSRRRLPTSRQGPTSRRCLSSAAFGERRSSARQVWRDRRARKRRKIFSLASPDKSENAEEISFPRSGGHSRSPSSATPHAGSAISPRAVALPRLQDCWAFARAFESNGKTPRERGLVEGHIFEFRPSRNDAVGDRVYSPRSLQKKAPMALISLDAELK
jgi:hypothetical protein